jgi:hypothetical protein
MARPKGLPKTGGRTKGSSNRRTKEIADRIMAEGITMAEIMVEAARALWRSSLGPDGQVINLELATEAGELAVKAAPYFHPKLAAVEHTGKDGSPLSPPVFNVSFGPDIGEDD